MHFVQSIVVSIVTLRKGMHVALYVVLREIKLEELIGEVTLVVGRWIHSTDNGLHHASCRQSRVRLPLFRSSAILVIGDAADYGEILAAVTQNALHYGIHLRIERKSAESTGELLPELIVPRDLSSGCHWRQMNPGAPVSSGKILQNNIN